VRPTIFSLVVTIASASAACRSFGEEPADVVQSQAASNESIDSIDLVASVVRRDWKSIVQGGDVKNEDVNSMLRLADATITIAGLADRNLGIFSIDRRADQSDAFLKNFSDMDLLVGTAEASLIILEQRVDTLPDEHRIDITRIAARLLVELASVNNSPAVPSERYKLFLRALASDPAEEAAFVQAFERFRVDAGYSKALGEMGDAIDALIDEEGSKLMDRQLLAKFMEHHEVVWRASQHRKWSRLLMTSYIRNVYSLGMLRKDEEGVEIIKQYSKKLSDLTDRANDKRWLQEAVSFPPVMPRKQYIKTGGDGGVNTLKPKNP
jgi:hypothetical protein